MGCIVVNGITGASVLARTSTRQATDSVILLYHFVIRFFSLVRSACRVALAGSMVLTGVEAIARSMIASGAPVPHVQGAVFDGSCIRLPGIAGAFVPARDASVRQRISVCSSFRLGSRRFGFRPAERFAGEPHLMHDNRQLAGYSYLCFSHATPFGYP